jgi:hypothetical protein
MMELSQAIEVLYDVLRQSSVGALPVLKPTLNKATSEEQLMADSLRSVQILYERLKRSQESASVVVNLLGVGRQ